jgi:hypothetical protein
MHPERPDHRGSRGRHRPVVKDLQNLGNAHQCHLLFAPALIRR